MSEKYPSHLKRLAPTLSKWRQMKRRELRAAKAQFSDCLLYTSPSPRD